MKTRFEHDVMTSVVKPPARTTGILITCVEEPPRLRELPRYRRWVSSVCSRGNGRHWATKTPLASWSHRRKVFLRRALMAMTVEQLQAWLGPPFSFQIRPEVIRGNRKRARSHP